MEKERNWFSKHVDTMVILGGVLTCFLWINSNINELRTDLAIVKTVLIMKNINLRRLH